MRTIDEWLLALRELDTLDVDGINGLQADLETAIEKRNALQTEFDELNHMLTHQPPSAWAKREKKYHDDKKAWDTAEAELKGKVKRMQEEVKVLKDNNRAVVLQEQVHELEQTLKELRKENSSITETLGHRDQALKSLKEEHAKIIKAHEESVQEAVTSRMQMRKVEEQLAAKTAEATAESSKAAESSRLLQALRRDFNESSLKGDGLKEQLEAMRAAQAAAQKKAAGEIDALNSEIQAARQKASAEATSHAEALSKMSALQSELQMMKEEHGEVSASARAREAARAEEARAALSKVNEVHQAELTAVKRQLIGLEDRCTSLMNERQSLNKQLKQARSDHEASLRAVKTAVATAAAEVPPEAAEAAAAIAAATDAAVPAQFRTSSGALDLLAADTAGVLRSPAGAPGRRNFRNRVSGSASISPERSVGGSSPSRLIDVTGSTASFGAARAAIEAASGSAALPQKSSELPSRVPSATAPSADEACVPTEKVAGGASAADTPADVPEPATTMDTSIPETSEAVSGTAAPSDSNAPGTPAVHPENAVSKDSAASNADAVEPKVADVPLPPRLESDSPPPVLPSEVAQSSAYEGAQPPSLPMAVPPVIPPPAASAPQPETGMPQALTTAALDEHTNSTIPKLTIDTPLPTTNNIVDMDDPENINITQQIAAWNRACGTLLPPSEQAVLLASGHAIILSDTLTALDRDVGKLAQTRMQECACKVAASIPMASRPAEYAGSSVVPRMRGLPEAGMSVLRAAARARTDRSMVADETDAEAAAQEAAGDQAIASAFARAMAADTAHTDRRLVSVANAVTLAEGVSHNGTRLSRGRIGLLRAAALRSAANAKVWKELAADEDFLEAFSVAMVSSRVPLPSGTTASITDEQRLLFQAAAAAVLSASDPDGEAEAERENGIAGSGVDDDTKASGNASRSLSGSASLVVRDGGGLDLSGLPSNNPGSRALREYAAQCETTVQVHQAQIEQLNRKLDDKDKELAALEEALNTLAPTGPDGERTIKGKLSGSEEQRLDLLQSWMMSSSTKQAERIKSLEAELLIAEQNLANCKTRLKELGADEASLATLMQPTASDQLIMSGDEDNYLTSLVVKLKVDLAETHGELMHCKRALTRATEREAKLQERVSMLEVTPVPVEKPRRGNIFTPRLFSQDTTPTKADAEPNVDTQARDELSAPEIEVGGEALEE